MPQPTSRAVPGLRPRLPLFADWHKAENRVAGTFGGGAAEVFDLTTVEKGEDTTVYHDWTAVLFRDASLPAFECFPTNDGWATRLERAVRPAVRFAAGDGGPAVHATAAFEAAYQLSPLHPTPEGPEPSPEADLRSLFRGPVLSVLGGRPGWRIQSADGGLLCARRGFADGEAREALCREAAEIADALRTPPHLDEPVLACPPGLETGRQRARLAGAGVGGLVGGVVGFFGSFAVFTAFLFAGGPGDGPGDGPANFFGGFFGSVFGGLFAGIALGVWIGRRIGGRCYRPGASADPPRPEPAGLGGWMVGGAFAGWAAGGATGLVLTVAATAAGAAAWAAPLLMFLPPTAGLISGGYLGQRHARRREARRASGPGGDVQAAGEPGGD